MAKQNIYDNENFFENFKNLRTDKINFNDCIETPILLAMIPEVNGKKVLEFPQNYPHKTNLLRLLSTTFKKCPKYKESCSFLM